mgnify:CR=1 FL=1
MALAATVRAGDRVVLHEPAWPNPGGAAVLRGATVDALAAVAELAAAAQPCRERRAETLGQGGAFALAAKVWGAPLLDELGEAEIAYPVAVGARELLQGRRRQVGVMSVEEDDVGLRLGQPVQQG